jgi:hypothetical protein
MDPDELSHPVADEARADASAGASAVGGACSRVWASLSLVSAADASSGRPHAGQNLLPTGMFA